jgi:hypothetical protein
MTSLAKFRKRLNKELSDDASVEIEVADGVTEVVADELQDDLSEEPAENTAVDLIPYEEAVDDIIEEVIELSKPVEFVLDPAAILEEPEKDELVSIEQHMANIDGMLKQELDDYALSYGIELDRRQTKQNMINEFITKLKEKN